VLAVVGLYGVMSYRLAAHAGDWRANGLRRFGGQDRWLVTREV
jgi:hypothetical protein